MPKLSVCFIRASLVYFFIGISIGAIMLANKGLPLVSSIWTFRSAHIEITLFGWIIQLVMGTAYWILPRLPVGRPRGNSFPAWLSFFLLNTGIIFGITTEWFLNSPALDAFSRFLQLAGIACFSYVIWPRIMTFRKEG